MSNTQYSLLLETTDGKLINLGSEWIGARVEYQKRAICFSEMIASEDFYYSDYWGTNNDECEYFINTFVCNDRIYLQSYVFDTTFELEMDFDHFELQYNQLEENHKLHVTTNPYFAFHDDVFPVFARNQVSQQKFNPLVSDRITLVPDNYFSTLEFFDHISTIMLEAVGIYAISFYLRMTNSILVFEKIIEIQLAKGQNLLSVEVGPNGTVQFLSDFLEDKIVSEKSIFHKEDMFLIKFNFESPSISFYDVDDSDGNSKVLRKKLTSFSKFKKQAVKVYKYGQQIEIKKFSYYRGKNIQDHMLLIFDIDDYSNLETSNFMISGDFKEDSYLANATIHAPYKVARWSSKIAGQKF